ncbi:NADPH-dependent F420 reductase [Marinoscillum sp. MHG1-6]|uniref:NADPH-dependent F420 reductase n=1 Tax=Marinoscillum sp. MHG1-6 TaxID=2959627 RepID=UPI0021583E24|nr:NAD(P)-binding domain-containing protein [Marinoscillum sp. MHG1-6]
MKRVGILGSGGVGKTLASGFKKHGFEVKIGTRDVSKLEDWSAHAGVTVGSFEEVASFGDIVVLAVKGHAAQAVLEMAGSGNLSGKTIIDATNPIDDKVAPNGGVLSFFTRKDSSLMEELQQAFPEANFVKAFNSVGAALMVDPKFSEGVPTMFIAGDDDGAKSEVKEILEKFGWEWEDMGSAVAARAIEPLCILWCIPGFLENRWSHAFKLLKQ